MRMRKKQGHHLRMEVDREQAEVFLQLMKELDDLLEAANEPSAVEILLQRTSQNRVKSWWTFFKNGEVSVALKGIIRPIQTMTKWFLMWFLCTLFFAPPALAQTLQINGKPSDVFIAGEEGYAFFRIPAVVRLGNTQLLAFAEGRKRGRSDTGDIDLVMKRSKDDGRSWGEFQVIWDDGKATCGNPAPIVDEESGDIYLLTTWNLGEDHEKEIIAQTSKDTRRVYLHKSVDNGKTWEIGREITKDVKLPNWTWYATGPGSGIQLKSDLFRGRLMVGCDHIEAGTKKYFSHCIFSDDHGKTWQLGGSSPRDQVNECEVVELSTGQLMMNMRNYDRDQKTRQVMFSSDGGITWYDQQHDSTLMEPICQASLHQSGEFLFFSNPDSPDQRLNMTVRSSADDGRTWSASLVLHSGPSAYSDLVSIGADELGCLFEAGQESPYEKIVFQQILIQ